MDWLFYTVCGAAVLLGVYASWVIIKTRNMQPKRYYVAVFEGRQILKTKSTNPSSTWKNLKKYIDSRETTKTLKTWGYSVKEIN